MNHQCGQSNHLQAEKSSFSSTPLSIQPGRQVLVLVDPSDYQRSSMQVAG
jgi:hypothetical protein